MGLKNMNIMKEEITKYIEERHGEKFNKLKDRMQELVSYPQNYKLKDVVYFKETKIKSNLGFIVSRQFRSAKTRKNTIFFPTSELASEYYRKIPQQMFAIVSDVMDKFVPISIEKQFEQFADIKDVKFGDVKKI